MTTYVFVHQNFPGQYGRLVQHLSQQPGNRIYFITQSQHGAIPGVRKLVYKPDVPAESGCHPYSAVLDDAVRTGVAVASVCKELRRRGVFPDLIVGHCGWGEMLLVKDVFPKVPVLSNFEFFFHPNGADVGFDREFSPRREADGGRLRVRNAINYMSADASDWGHTATAWQHSLFPRSLQSRISALHEGIDTERCRPNERAWLKLAPSGIHLTPKSEVITYVSRNLEPYRGFHIFMRALPEVLRRRPRAHVLIVGGDGVSYGAPPGAGRSYRDLLLAEVGDRLDLERVHFMGTVAPEIYLAALQVSSVHVYLTYPFVLSWSFAEALSAGCLVVGSATPPVREFLRDGENGILVDFFDVAGLTDRLEEALANPQRQIQMRAAARQTAVEELDFQSRMLPRWLRLLDNLAAGREPQAGVSGAVQPRLAAPAPVVRLNS